MRNSIYKRWRLFAALNVLLTLVFANGVCAVETRPLPPPLPKMSALIITLQNYDKGHSLPNDNDGETLNDVLQSAGWSVTRVPNDSEPIVSTGKYVQKKNLEAQIFKWIEDLSEGCVALLYFSGHGVKDRATGKLYLPTPDYYSHQEDADRFENHAISFDEIARRLKKAKCANRIAFLDACYSGAGGASKGDDAESFTNDDLQKVFTGKSDSSAENQSNSDSTITVFTSSSAEEVSRCYNSLKISAYTYWLCDALTSMRAGKNHKISLSELGDYLKTSVAREAESVNEKQTPCVFNIEANKDFGFARPALGYGRICEKCVKRTTNEIERRFGSNKKIRALIAPSFVERGEQDSDKEKWGTVQTDLPRNVRAKLEASEICEVLNEEKTKDILNRHSLDLNNLSENDLEELFSDPADVDAIIRGRLSEVLDEDTNEPKGEIKFSYTIDFNTSKVRRISVFEYILKDKEWYSATGRAFETKPNDSTSSGYYDTSEGVMNAVTYQAIQNIEEQTSNHVIPLDSTEKRDYDVEIRACSKDTPRPQEKDYKPRPLKKDKDGKYWTYLEKGEKYKIVLRNNTPQTAYVRVFIDGVSSYDPDFSEVRKAGTMKGESAKTMDRDAVTPWAVDHNSTVSISGFCHPKGTPEAKDEIKYFEVVSADESIAGDKKEEIGLINVNFLRQTTKSRGSIGTKPAKEGYDVKITKVVMPPVEIAVSYQIYYCTYDEFKEK